MSHSASVPGRIWPQLPRELAERIATCLSHNEVPCTLRLVNKAAAEQFRGPQHTKVRLSQPTPAHAFAWRWGAPSATRPLTYKQRIQLLCLTAASGSIPNMEVALASAGCLPTGKVLSAAAAAGQLPMCEWLLQQGCPCDGALEAAAQGGQRDACMWLLERGPVHESRMAFRGAARGGHVGLMGELLRLYQSHPADALRPPQNYSYWSELLAGVAEGCDLATLQRLHHEWLEVPGQGAQQQPQQQQEGVVDFVLELDKAYVVAKAGSSPTLDWRAKVEWLEGQGYPRTLLATQMAAGRPDAVERLEWLRQRGYPLGAEVAHDASCTGSLYALQYLHARGVEITGVERMAAENGHLEAAMWLVERPGSEAALDGSLFEAAAASGSIELLAWLRGRGCPWGKHTFAQAAYRGNAAALEWLVQRGCPMEVNGGPYLTSCRNNDLATLRCLARLGCPWGPDGVVFNRVWLGVQLPTLRALLSAGCPVDWEAAEARVRSGGERVGRVEWAVEVLALLASERARRQGLEAGAQGGGH